MAILKYSLISIKRHKYIIFSNLLITVIGCFINYLIANTLYGIVSKYDYTATEKDKTKIFTKKINLQEIGWIICLLFLYFYNNEVLKNYVHTTVASVINYRYNKKSKLDLRNQKPVFLSLKNITYYNFGSVCFGSLLVAVIRFFQGALKVIEIILLPFMIIKSIIKSIFGLIPYLGPIIYIIGISLVFPFYLSILLIEYVLKGIDFLMKYFNFYTFVQVAINNDSFFQSSKYTFSIMIDFKNTALINDYIIRLILMIGQYSIILFGVFITKAFSKILKIEEDNIIIYITGVTLIFKKLFASITQAVLSSTVSIFVILVRSELINENKELRKLFNSISKNFSLDIKNYNIEITDERLEDIKDIFNFFKETIYDPVDVIKNYYNSFVSYFLNEKEMNIKLFDK